MTPFFSAAQRMLSEKKKRYIDINIFIHVWLNVCVCVCVCAYKDWNKDSPHLVQIEPIPDDTHDESYGTHPTDLQKPRHLWPQLSGYGRHRNRNEQSKLWYKQREHGCYDTGTQPSRKKQQEKQHSFETAQQTCCSTFSLQYALEKKKENELQLHLKLTFISVSRSTPKSSSNRHLHTSESCGLISTSIWLMALSRAPVLQLSLPSSSPSISVIDCLDSLILAS